MSEKKKKFNVRMSVQTLTTLAILMAAQAVIEQLLTIHTMHIKISLSFIPVVIAARLYGMAGGALVAGLGDIVGYIFHPVGAWFPPITITYAVVGMMFGLFFKKKADFKRILVAVLISEFISLFVTTLWISFLSYPSDGGNFWAFYITKLTWRIPQILIITALKLVIIPPMFKAMERIKFTKQIIEA